MDWCIAEHYLKLKAQELKQCIFSLIEHRRLLGSQFWGNAGNFVWKILGDARPTLIHKKCLHRGWELPQILRNPNHQVLVVCQAHVLLCHQQAIFSILWKTDCCLLFTVGAAPVPSLLWPLLIFPSWVPLCKAGHYTSMFVVNAHD